MLAWSVKMTSKGLIGAKQQREKFLLEFRAACADLEEELEPVGGKLPSRRKIKIKIKLVRVEL